MLLRLCLHKFNAHSDHYILHFFYFQLYSKTTCLYAICIWFNASYILLLSINNQHSFIFCNPTQNFPLWCHTHSKKCAIKHMWKSNFSLEWIFLVFFLIYISMLQSKRKDWNMSIAYYFHLTIKKCYKSMLAWRHLKKKKKKLFTLWITYKIIIKPHRVIQMKKMMMMLKRHREISLVVVMNSNIHD